MLLNCGAGGDSWKSLGLQREQTYPSWRKSSLSAHWKNRSWSWGSNTLAISWEEKTPWKRPWCWESVKARGEGDDRRWDGGTVSLKLPTWIWPNSRRQWKTGGAGVLWSMGSWRVGHDLMTKQQQQHCPTYSPRHRRRQAWQDFGKGLNICVIHQYYSSLVPEIKTELMVFKHQLLWQFL